MRYGNRAWLVSSSRVLSHDGSLRRRCADGWVAHAVSAGFYVAGELALEGRVGSGLHCQVVPAERLLQLPEVLERLMRFERYHCRLTGVGFDDMHALRGFAVVVHFEDDALGFAIVDALDGEVCASCCKAPGKGAQETIRAK